MSTAHDALRNSPSRAPPRRGLHVPPGALHPVHIAGRELCPPLVLPTPLPISRLSLSPAACSAYTHHGLHERLPRLPLHPPRTSPASSSALRILTPPQFLFSIVLLGLSASRLHYTIFLPKGDPLNNGHPFYDPIVVELAITSIFAMFWSAYS